MKPHRPHLRVRLDPLLLADVQAIAGVMNMTVGQFTEWALREYIAEMRKRGGPELEHVIAAMPELQVKLLGG